MSRNLLPYDLREARRYGFSWVLMRTLLLRISQSRSFRRADGTIFLTRYAYQTVTEITKPLRGCTAIIPHGIDARFFRAPREQLSLSSYSPTRPFRVLYTSIIDLYKHQSRVVEAVARLRKRGFSVVVEFIGSGYPPAVRQFEAACDQHDPQRQFVIWRGSVPHCKLHHKYHEADLFVFASTCENLPNILLEGMAAGLPIACSNREPMPDVLGEGGTYFNPLDADDIANALERLITEPEARISCSAEAYRRAQKYSWDRCARETWSFLKTVAENTPASVDKPVLNCAVRCEPNGVSRRR